MASNLRKLRFLVVGFVREFSETYSLTIPNDITNLLYILCPFFWYKCGSNMTINAPVVNCKSGYSGFTCYSAQTAKLGINEWVIKVLKKPKRGMTVGIASTSNKSDGCFHVGYLSSAGQKVAKYLSFPASYGARYNSGDNVTVYLDLNQSIIVFKKNGISQGIAYLNIQNLPYRLAVYMDCYGDGGSVEMISYKYHNAYENMWTCNHCDILNNKNETKCISCLKNIKYTE
eukprot:426306_1